MTTLTELFTQLTELLTNLVFASHDGALLGIYNLRLVLVSERLNVDKGQLELFLENPHLNIRAGIVWEECPPLMRAIWLGYGIAGEAWSQVFPDLLNRVTLRTQSRQLMSPQAKNGDRANRLDQRSFLPGLAAGPSFGKTNFISAVPIREPLTSVHPSFEALYRKY